MMTLEGWSRCLAARFGAPVWLVGSALTDPETARDVDVRVVLPDAQFAARYGPVAAWVADGPSQLLVDDTAHLSAGGSEKLGVNLDLQLWPASEARRAFPEAARRLLAAPRVLNADVRLLEFLHVEVGRPYAWGDTDCGSLVRRATAVVYGADLFEDVPVWKSKAGATKAQQATGGVRALMLSMGARMLPLAYAQTGDVVTGPAEDGFPFAGVVIDRRVLTAAPKVGVFAHTLSECPPGTEILRWFHG